MLRHVLSIAIPITYRRRARLEFLALHILLSRIKWRVANEIRTVPRSIFKTLYRVGAENGTVFDTMR